MKKLYLILIAIISPILFTELMHASNPFVNILNLSNQNIIVQLKETDKDAKSPVTIKSKELKKI